MKKSVGTKIKIGSDYIGGLTSINIMNKTADTLDTTTLDNESGYRTFTTSWKDAGELSLSGYFKPGDIGQIAMDTAFEAGQELPFQIIPPAAVGTSYSFNGVITALTMNAELEELISWEATVKVSGKMESGIGVSAGLSALALTGTGGALSPAFANGLYSYSFGGVSAPSVTVSATAAAHTLKLFVDGAFHSNLTTAVASAAIPLTLNVGKRLTIVAYEDGKSPKVYEVLVIKTT